MTEQVFIETVTDVSSPDISGELFVGYENRAGEKYYCKAFIPSRTTIEKFTRELPGKKIAVLEVDGKLECLVVVEELDERGHLKSWTKIGEGHYSASQEIMLRNNLPIVH